MQEEWVSYCRLVLCDKKGFHIVGERYVKEGVLNCCRPLGDEKGFRIVGVHCVIRSGFVL